MKVNRAVSACRRLRLLGGPALRLLVLREVLVGLVGEMARI
jgi:hypothetical protein